MRGLTFLMRDDAEQARQEFLSVTGVTPDTRVNQTFNVGCAYLGEGKHRDAEGMFQKAIVLADAIRRDAAPGTATGIAALRGAHFNLGRMLAVEGRTANAIREFQAGEEISAKGAAGRPDPYVVMSRYLIGSALVRKRDYTAALSKADEIRDLVKKNGFNAPLLDYGEFLVAEVAEARGDQKALGGALDRVTSVHRYNSPIYWRLAAARSTLDGDVAAALAICERIRTGVEMSRFDSGQAFTYFYERSRLGYTRGRVFEQGRNAVKAREQYSQFLTLMANAAPGIPDVEDAKKRLAALGPR